MYTIILEGGARVWDIPNRAKLYEQILASENDVTDVYERTTPVTNRVRKALASQSPTTLLRATAAARRFMSRPQPARTTRQW